MRPTRSSIAKFLALMPDSGPQSFFQDIERVEPGHFVTVTPTGLAVRRHWEPRRRWIALRSPDEYAEALRELLDRAVRCRLRGAGDVGAHLSGGLDSPAVAATAARLLAPSGRRVIAFTAVPREGYDGPAPRDRIIDEGPDAAATAALYPNMEHVLMPSDGRSPLDDLDRSFFLFDQPVYNIGFLGWPKRIYDAARERKLTIVLSGAMGNFGLSHDGRELLAELLLSGRWLHLWREAAAFTARARVTYRTALALIFGPWCPSALWLWLNRLLGRTNIDALSYSAIRPHYFAELDLAARARGLGVDLANRPRKDGFSVRLWALRNSDRGNYNKGVLGGWQIDERDPTADVRLLEFCLAVPTEQFLPTGTQKALARRALADRLPKRVLDERRTRLAGCRLA